MDVFELVGRIAIEGADKAEKVIDSISGKSGKLGTIFGKMGSMAATGMKVAGAAIATAGTAVGGLVAKSVSAYGEFEQLVGGVDTLFKESSQKVQTYADNAYKTAGLSASDYMETVTSFSASLLQSLNGDTEKAADAANMAVIDMADNMNKMGSSMESIKNAYQGFAKQNYTMLDNLKLGYGGTKEEMERLLDDAQELSGVEYDIENLSDVYNAIHVIQTELGITGTTAKEADATISGSFASMKSALDNFITGFGDENADMDTLFSNLIDSADTFLNGNLIPTVERILKTVIDKIPEFLPKLVQSLGKLIEGTAPALIDSAKALLRSLLSTVLDLIPGMTDDVKNTALKALDSIFEAFETFIEAAGKAADEVLPVLIKAIGIIADSLGGLAKDILPPLSRLLSALANILSPILDLLEPIVGFVTDLAGGLIGGVIDILARLFGYDEHDELVKKFSELSGEEQAVVDKTKELKDEQEKLDKSLKNGFDGIDGTYLKYDKLVKKLDEMTDSSGKVKEGHENQAEYILNELNSAFGTEMEMVGGVIQKYQEERQTLEDLMAAKKAQAYLNSAEDEYTQALKNQTEIQNNYANAVNEYNKALSEESDLKQKIADMEKYAEENQGTIDLEKYSELTAKLEGVQNRLEQLKVAKRDTGMAMSDNSAIINNFESMTEAIAENDIPKMEEAMDNMKNNFIDASDGTKEALADQTVAFKKNYEEMLEASKVKGSKITQAQVSNAQEMYRRSLTEWSKLTGMSSSELERQLGVVNSYNGSFSAAGAKLGDSLINGIRNAINGSASSIASAMQAVIDSAQSGVVVSLPTISAGTYTGKINSWSDAKMAGHAKGGIVTREHIARVGEDGAEAIIPLEHNTEWIDRVAERLNGSGSGDVIAKLDELNSSIKSLKIYLDGEALVGGIAPAMDKKLGSISRLKRRSAV